jgi:GDPmannose 4,6-dehydratase
VFAELGLDWQAHVTTDKQLYRPSEIRASHANPAHIRAALGWRHSFEIEDVVREMVKHQMGVGK